MIEETIWCWTGDPDRAKKELCDPIGYVEEKDDDINLCGYGDENLKGNKAVSYVGC